MSEELEVAKWNNNVIIRREKSATNNRLFSEFNKVFISGKIEEEFEYSHKTFLETFYRTRVIVTRFSGTEDLIPIVVSNLLISEETTSKQLKGKWVEVAGQFRSYNRFDKEGHKHLEVFLFVTEIKIYENEEEMDEAANENLIYLDGYICRPPVFRQTLLGRKITDLFIGVNRPYGKSDYIPCIAWGRVAQWASNLEVGNQVKLYGRIQSREYFKRDSPDSEKGEYRIIYEVSVMSMKKVESLSLK